MPQLNPPYLYKMNNDATLLAAMLAKLNISSLNPMQEACIAACKTESDVMVLSQTGSGKTLAFLLPILNRLIADKSETQALIIVPTRELALQIEKVFRLMQTGYSVTCCYGGHRIEVEENNLQANPTLVIGTPGRLCDHINKQSLHLAEVHSLVLDEFDKSLELGFSEQMRFILAAIKAEHLTLFTSATEIDKLPDFISHQQPFVLNFLTEQPIIAQLELRLLASSDKDKLLTLYQLLCTTELQSVMVFCNHRESVERTATYLTKKGISNTFYHGGLEQHERDSALIRFRNGTALVLVTTDLGARGLDIPDVGYVVHYHLPHEVSAFIHRNGRTARMHATGMAIVLLAPDEVLPDFIPTNCQTHQLPSNLPEPMQSNWVTLFAAAGKKDKVNKVDIVGFLMHQAALKKEEIGIIEVKDHAIYVAIAASKAQSVLQKVQGEKLKGQKVKMAIAW